MKKIIDIFANDKNVIQVKEDIFNYNSVLVNNTTITHNALLVSNLFFSKDKFIIYVASNLYKATQMYEMLCDNIGLENVNLYVVDEIASIEAKAISKEFKVERLHTIQSIIKNQKKIIVTHVNAIIRYIIPFNEYSKSYITIKKGDIINTNTLIEQLISLGYIKRPTTNEVGFFSVRGEIIDIFPFGYDHPVRIDFFDDEIEIVKEYDEATQKSIKEINSVEIYANKEIIYHNKEQVVSNILKDDPTNADVDDILSYNNDEYNQKYIKYMYEEVQTFLDYIESKIIFYEEPKRIFDSFTSIMNELSNFSSIKKLKTNYNENYYDIYKDSNKKVYLCEFKTAINDLKIDKISNMNGLSVINYHNNIKNFIEDISISNEKVIISVPTKEKANLLKESLELNHISYGFFDISLNEKVIILISENNFSFKFVNSKYMVISINNIFNYKIKHNPKYRSVMQDTRPINSKDELVIGDYVVHYDYGIARYLGIKTVKLQNIISDYIRLLFENMELLIPVEKINLIEKYIGSEASCPKLTTVGNKEWEKKKKKIKEKLEILAKDLIQTQASREKLRGFIYQKDEEIQKEFEERFEYVETPDQLKAISEIKDDMEKGLIIDRLVCGDVGYGKTEIAIRIALKTVINKKQVAYLAPTTILTRQHYYTFKERLEQYGLRVELLNRLVSLKKQKEIIDGLKKGYIDIVIGTHSLLNDSIKYKDLGLLIVDEEQRFGVTHKEKIKQYKNTINVLSLSATPIPRTLQMSIMGIRQLSLIETPPLNRYPIQTYVMESNDNVIREAIYKELARSGQVFYLHNRVSDLELVYNKIQRLVPEAKIRYAHGQMPKEQLEEVIQSFIDKEFDVLICTTIIETGIDIPNTNTLIVDRADYLGLAQMYQIRGRVGRSSRVSYAYFMYDKQKVLTDESSKRLNAIKEFTSFGSGYKIAIRDLAIRGAGDILGKEQSGFINSIGLDMYMKMLNEVIEEQTTGQSPKQEEPYNIEISKHINNEYVSDDDIKIYIHKVINKIDSLESKQNLIEELTDRFGKINAEIRLYIEEQYLESIFEKIGVDKIEENQYSVRIVLKEDTIVDAQKLFMKGYMLDKNFYFEYKSKKIHIRYKKNCDDKKWIYTIVELLEQFCI